MRILQVCSATNMGGGEQHVADLTRWLAARGHELHLAVRPHSPLRATLSEVKIHWHELPLRGALDLISARKLARLIQEQQLEIVHAHVARDYPICGVATKPLPARFFITRHHFHPIRKNALYESVILHARRLIAVSETVRYELETAFPRMTDVIEVIPNWIDLTKVGTAKRSEARKRLGITREYAVGMIGQLTPLKRQDLLIEAARLMTEEGNWSRAEFVSVGAAQADDAAYENKLHQMAKALHDPSQLRFAGYVPNIAEYLKAFDVVVAPSDNEAFSLVVVEAMAAGCAVIATAAGGPGEIIQQNKTGILIEPGNAEMLAAELRDLLFDKTTRKKLGIAAQTAARERFDRETILTQIEQLYREA